MSGSRPSCWITALFCLGLAASPVARADDLPDLDADQPYQADRSDPIQHEIEFVVVVTPRHGTELLKVWLPIPQNDLAQTISKRHISTFPAEVQPTIHTEPMFGNQFAYFEFRNPQGAQIIRHRFTARVWNLHWNLDPSRVSSVKSWPEAFQPYLRQPKLKHQQQYDQVMQQLLSEGPSNGNGVLRAMQWIDQNLTYDHLQASLSADVDHALSLRRGHCSDYHGLCATMGRTMGYPACVTYGLALTPKASPSHCKMEVYLPPYGWVSFDLSETQKLVGRIQTDTSLDDERRAQLVQAARDRLQQGFRENSWLQLTRGTDFQLAPPASQPVKIIRTIYAEADGQPLPEPDPSNANQQQFSWMTAHKYTADKAFKLPFQDASTLQPAVAAESSQ